MTSWDLHSETVEIPDRQEFLDLETKSATAAQNCVTRDTASTIINWRSLDNEARRKAAKGGFTLKKRVRS